jgi:hypothetical protein
MAAYNEPTIRPLVIASTIGRKNSLMGHLP